MNLFTCPVCRNQIYFENFRCNECDSDLGFLFEEQSLVALENQGDGKWGAIGGPSSWGTLRRCKNFERNSCNWIVSVDEKEEFCPSCRLTTDIPDLSVPENQAAWIELERAKRRMLYSLQSLGLPIESFAEKENGLRFRLLQGTPEAPVMTGHDQGTITINIAEADDSYREKQRSEMGELYRTPLGHFRHEIGHYYFDRLVFGSPHLEPFRSLFGDERAPYQDALKRHYESGPPENFEENYISAYATMHPWEDWAETWAHYLHMVDTLETAQSYGISVTHPADGEKVKVNRVDLNNFEALFEAWIPVTLAINGLNRSMGLADAYPFTVSAKVKDKLAFVHHVIHSPREVKSDVRDEGSQLHVETKAPAVQNPGAPIRRRRRVVARGIA